MGGSVLYGEGLSAEETDGMGGGTFFEEGKQ